MKSIPVYDFNLDYHPSKRWETIFDDNADKINKVRTKIKEILHEMNYGSISLVIKPIISILKFMGKIYYVDEITYIAEKMKMTFDEVLVLQLIYESSSACTSAVLNIGDSNVFFRTMDWPMEFLKDITIQLNIKKNDIHIATGITWIGYVGLLTASTMVNNYAGGNGFSVSVNYRKTKDISLSDIVNNAYRTLGMKWPIGYLVRDIIEKNTGCHRALNLLSESCLVSPCYITMFIPNGTSVIITRDADSAVSVRNTNTIQANCDHDKTEPDILWSCRRRDLVKVFEKDLDRDARSGVELNVQAILAKMLVHPVLNEETVYVYCWYKGKSEAYIT
jgi:hypothetical protein